MSSRKQKCFFFDRDGIVNRSPGAGYVESWEEFHLFPEFPVVLKKVIDAGYAGVIITNQSCVAKGIITESVLLDMHARLRKMLRDEHGIDVLDVYYCPHNSDTCDCRKPKPGMILKAAAEHNLDLAGSWVVGDQHRDIETGKRAGCRTIYVTDDPQRNDADITVAGMKELVSIMDNLLASHSSVNEDRGL